MITGISGTAIIVLFGLALIERWGTARARRAVPLRIHVNGTRGKSTTTVVIRNMFEAAGKKAVAKITGELPYVIDPDGNALQWKRTGPARVQEQARFLRWAAQRHAEVAVVECMALNPEYQAISEQLVRANIAVITNARLDHLEEMGTTRKEIARSLLRMMPSGGVLIAGDKMVGGLARVIAEHRRTQVKVIPPATSGRGFASAIAVAREILNHTALNESEKLQAEAYLQALGQDHPEDFQERRLGKYLFVPLWTVNDPDSLYEHLSSSDWPKGPMCVLFNHRSDRPLRTQLFAELFAQPELQISAVIVMSEFGLGTWMFRRILGPDVKVRRALRSRKQIVRMLNELELPPNTVIVGAGNWKHVPENVR